MIKELPIGTSGEQAMDRIRVVFNPFPIASNVTDNAANVSKAAFDMFMRGFIGQPDLTPGHIEIKTDLPNISFRKRIVAMLKNPKDVKDDSPSIDFGRDVLDVPSFGRGPRYWEFIMDVRKDTSARVRRILYEHCGAQIEGIS